MLGFFISSPSRMLENMIAAQYRYASLVIGGVEGVMKM